MKRVFSVLLCLCLLLCLLPVTAFAATQITALTITNLPTPMAGNKVSVSATINTTGAQLDSMDWYDHTAGQAPSGGMPVWILIAVCLAVLAIGACLTLLLVKRKTKDK